MISRLSCDSSGITWQRVYHVASHVPWDVLIIRSRDVHFSLAFILRCLRYSVVKLRLYLYDLYPSVLSSFTHIFILQNFPYQIVYRNKQGAEGRHPLGYTASSEMSASSNSHGDRNMNIWKGH